jgi:hypothetical protein
MRESDIVHDAGSYWVGRDRGAYTVYAAGLTSIPNAKKFER